MKATLSTWVVCSVFALVLACSETTVTGSTPLPPSVAVSGVVTSDSGIGVAGASLWIRLWDTTFRAPHTDTTVITDVSGAFVFTQPIDSQLTDGVVQIDATPPFGSGLANGFAWLPLTFDSAGQADTSGVRISALWLAPPVPEGPVAALDPARLIGAYSGETVPPYSNALVFLDLAFDSVTDSVYGHYTIDTDASTACGNKLGTLTGLVANDTLQMRLVSDTYPTLNRPRLVTYLLAMTYSPQADTLIVRYPEVSGDCSFGKPAPLRLLRQ